MLSASTPGGGPAAHAGRGSGRASVNAIDILAPAGTPVIAVEDELIHTANIRPDGVLLTVMGRGAKTFGSSLNLLGNSGTNYFYTHLRSDLKVNDGDSVKKGQILGFITNGEAAGNVSHVHFAITNSDTDSTVFGKAPSARLVRLSEAQAEKQGVSSGGILGPAAPDNESANLPASRKQIKATKKRFQIITARIGEAIREDFIKGPVRKKAQQGIKALNKLFGDKTITLAELDKIKTRVNKIGGIWRSALDRAKAVVTSRRDTFTGAFGNFMDRVLRVFDAKTEKLVEQLEVVVTVAGRAFKVAQGGLTPAEQALADLDKQRNEDAFSRRKTDARRKLTEAVAGGDANAFRDAIRELRDIEAEEERRALEEKAVAERKAADESLAEGERNLRAEREQARDRVQEQLNRRNDRRRHRPRSHAHDPELGSREGRLQRSRAFHGE